jgi:hypothetical protein
VDRLVDPAKSSLRDPRGQFEVEDIHLKARKGCGWKFNLFGLRQRLREIDMSQEC